jgi:hypothetical protein
MGLIPQSCSTQDISSSLDEVNRKITMLENEQEDNDE